MAVTGTTLAVIGITTAVTYGISAVVDYYQQAEEIANAKSDTGDAAAAAIKRNNVAWAGQKTEAAQAVAGYQADAGQTQVAADDTRSMGRQSLASNLSEAAGQSIQANQQVAALAGNTSRNNSALSARSGASGVKNTGSTAELSAETLAEGAKNLKSVSDSVSEGFRATASGAALGNQQIDSAYGGAMYNKNKLLTKAAEIRASYAAGGVASNNYEAGNAYANTMTGLQVGQLDRQKERLDMNAPFNILSAAFQGASTGIQFANSMNSFSSKPTQIGGNKIEPAINWDSPSSAFTSKGQRKRNSFNYLLEG